MFSARIELASSRVLGGRDNHYTKKTYNAETIDSSKLFDLILNKFMITMTLNGS